MVRRKNSKGLVYLLVVICVVLLAISVFWLFARSAQKVDSAVFEVKFGVVDFGIGIDVSPGVLSYGDLNPGGSAERGVILRNNFDFPVRVEVLKSESITDFLEVESDLFLEPGEILEVDIRINIPENAALREYSGEIKFEMYKEV